MFKARHSLGAGAASPRNPGVDGTQNETFTLPVGGASPTQFYFVFLDEEGAKSVDTNGGSYYRFY